MTMSQQDGIINLDKPVGLTSAKAVYRVRSITRVRKSGHAGSLDPGATGVLVVCQGRATKLVERVMDLPKVYRAKARLDVTSVSFDSDSDLEPVAVASVPTGEQVDAVMSDFEGVIAQVPPRVSAIKLGGVPAYRTVGRKDAPPLRPRRAQIYWLHVHAYDWPELDFEMACGRGTYVRALIRDVGFRLGTGGCLTSLRRTAVGPFRIEEAWTLDQMSHVTDGLPYLVPLERAREWVDRRPVQVPRRPK